MKQCLSIVSLALLGATAAFAQAALNTFPSRIVGHPNAEQLAPLASSTPNLVEGRELYNPEGIALDTTSSPAILYVSDTGNNRVLAWKNATAFSNGQKADLVIGQADLFSTNPQGPSTAFSAGLTTPTGVAVDSKGNLYVVDSGNNRVLRFPKPFAQQVVNPDLVIGQGSFTANVANPGGIGGKGFSFGGAVANLAFSPLNGDLFVSDPGNRRVLGFHASDLTPNNNGPSAYIEIGQNDFTTTQTTLNYNLPASLLVKNQFAVPRGVGFDSAGRLYVTDYDPNANTLCTTLTGRVLVFDTANVATRASASWIYGVFPAGYNITQDQANRACLLYPTGVFTLPDGTVGVVESGASRILFFPAANSTWPSDGSSPLAIQVSVSGARGLIGHTDFTNRLPNDWQGTQNGELTPPASAGTLWSPVAAAYSASTLLIADTGNNRVLAMPQQTGPSFGPASHWLGQDRSDTNSINLIEGREFNFQADAGLAVDSTGSTPHLYVADSNNHRILGFRDLRKVAPGSKADLVIGQPDMQTALCNYNPQTPSTSGNVGQPNQSSLCGPIGVLVDSKGNLYVADSGNGRVLRFPAPFAQTAAGMPQADLVLGKQSFTDTISDPSSRTLRAPYGLAFSGVNGLLVSDVADNRVLFFPFTDTVNNTFTPGGNGGAATVVYGQSNFTSITAGPTTPNAATLTYPRHIASDTSGRVYVADTGNNRVQIFGDPHTATPTGSSAVYSISGLSSPRGLFVSPNTGELWVANTNSGTCLKYPQFDTLQFGTGQYVAGVNGASYTLAVAQDQYGDLFVADASNRVAIYYPSLTALNGANFLPGRALAPGVLASICAGDSNNCQASASTQFGSQTATNGIIPWSKTLGDVQVMFDGVAAPLYFVSPYQINFLVPMGARTSGNSDVQVLQPSTGRILGDGTVPMNVASPGILMRDFSGSLRRAWVQNINKDGSWAWNDTSAAAARGSTITIWGTGQGFIPGAPADGDIPSAPLWTPVLPRVAIGIAFTDNVALQPGDPPNGKFISYSGLSSFPGLWQINVQIPMSVVPGTAVPLAISMNDIASQDPTVYKLTIAVQ
jgi:uncharacterized protein (TIGR03437 family)